MSARTRTASSPKTRGGWSRPSCRTSSAAMWNTTSPPIWKPNLTTSRPASVTTRTCWPASGATFRAAVAETADLRIGEVLDKIDDFLAPHLYPPRADGSDPRICPTCGTGRLHLKTARSGGAFIGCGNYPECRYTRPIWRARRKRGLGWPVLGHEDGPEISLRNGRFGPYVQRGEATEATRSPTAPACPKAGRPTALTLDRALALLSCPAPSGRIPKTARWSRRRSAASVPTSSTDRSMPISRMSRRSSPSA
jgi:ssDNA-binding Zn-finger/Zn-ribbon topoisomerase 1